MIANILPMVQNMGVTIARFLAEIVKKKKAVLALPWNYYQHGETGRTVATTAKLSGDWYSITKEQYEQHSGKNI